MVTLHYPFRVSINGHHDPLWYFGSTLCGLLARLTREEIATLYGQFPRPFKESDDTNCLQNGSIVCGVGTCYVLVFACLIYLLFYIQEDYFERESLAR